MRVELGAFVVVHGTSDRLWHLPAPGVEGDLGDALCGLDGGVTVCYRGSVRARRCCGVCLARGPVLVEAVEEEAEDEPVVVRPRGPVRRVSEPQLRALHVLYERGVSCGELGRMVWERLDYPSARNAEAAIWRGFRALGLAVRSQSEATVARNWRHGRATRAGREHGEEHGPGGYRAWLREREGRVRPRCVGVRTQYPGRGERCERPAAAGSVFCPSHDPARRGEREAHLAAARARARGEAA